MTQENATAARFFGLVFAISVPFWVFGALIDRSLLPGLPVSAVMVVCPTLAAAAILYRQGGRSALGAFFAQAKDWHAMPVWAWLVALGTMPFVLALSALILVSTGTDLPPPDWRLSQVVSFFALFLVAGLLEELGWTGYATRRLVERHSILMTGAIVGSVAAVWHLIPLLQADRTVDWIAWWAFATISRRVMIVWLFVRGGKSVFGASLVHAMSNVSWMMFPVMGSHYDPRSVALVTCGLAAALVLMRRGNRKAS